MSTTAIRREIASDGSVVLRDERATFTFRRSPGSKSVELTIAIAQHLSQTGKLIQIYSDEELFEARKAQATRR